MKLHYSSHTPYVRKLRVLAIETGLTDRIDLAEVTITPVDPNADLCADNPVGKIPTLVRDDGGALGYLDYRYSDQGWRDSRPELAAWFEKIAARPSMSETTPP